MSFEYRIRRGGIMNKQVIKSEINVMNNKIDILKINNKDFKSVKFDTFKMIENK